MAEYRLLICALASVLLHFAIARGLDELPDREPPVLRERVTVRVVEPPKPIVPEPPPREPPKPPEPKPEPKLEAKPKPKAPTPAITQSTEPPPQQPPLSSTSTTGDPNAKPKFGVTMESTSSAGKTQAPVGNTTSPTAPSSTDPGPPKPLPPAAAHEVTKMPLPQGRCAGKYTEAARAAAIEGVVVLDVIVDETGKPRDIQVVEGLSHGLTEAAIAALRACQFTPGERDGKPVPVRVRGFKIRFLLQDGG